MVLDLLEDLSGQDDDRGGAVTDLCVLRSGNVDEDSSGGVDDVEELRGGESVIAVQDERTSQGIEMPMLPTFMTVAPSLVIVWRPFSSTMSRSPP